MNLEPALGVFQSGRPTVIIDGQWGSTGKGKLAGYLHSHYDVDLTVCDFMPNAGHVYVGDDGESITFRQLPVGAAFGVDCCIGPHASIDLELLRKEVISAAEFAGRKPRVFVHPMVAVVDQECLEVEVEATRAIAGTAKGGHAAQIAKVRRDGKAKLAKSFSQSLRAMGCEVVDTYVVVQDHLHDGRRVLIETAQGFDLGLNHGWDYPYVTGRDCMVGRALDNAGVSPKKVGTIIASLRTYPIRVGNTEDGESGPYHHDQRELSWEQLSDMAGMKVSEMTTVTRRVRRVFTWSDHQVDRFTSFVRPDLAFLNFVNYWPEAEVDRNVDRVRRLLDRWGCRLHYLGVGARNNEMLEQASDGSFHKRS